MDIDAHVTATDETARYPGAGSGDAIALAYVALGLAGETSELLEKVAADDTLGIAAEAGDVLWYCSRFHRECRIDPTLTFGSDGHDEPTDPMVALVIAAGRIAELVKKAIRDDSGALTDARRGALIESLGRLAAAWLALHAAHGLDPGATAQANVDKLLGRMRRDTIAGSGDER